MCESVVWHTDCTRVLIQYYTPSNIKVCLTVNRIGWYKHHKCNRDKVDSEFCVVGYSSASRAMCTIQLMQKTEREVVNECSLSFSCSISLWVNGIINSNRMRVYLTSI